VRDGKLVGASIVGRNTDRPPITGLINEQQDVSQIVDTWADPNMEISA